MSDITISSIVAMAKNRVIGKNNTLIWHLPEDLKHFKRTTMGAPIIMGRKSYDSIGKPLPGRPNLVISRSQTSLEGAKPTPHFSNMESVDTDLKAKVQEGPFLFASIEDSIKASKEMAKEIGCNEIFITGGGQIYAETLPITERLYLTILDRDYDGDIFFPEINWSDWNVVEEVKHAANEEKDLPSFTIYTLERIS